MENLLPEKFLQRMKNMLKEDYDDFLAEYKKKPYKGLRVNTLKCSAEKLQGLLDVKLLESPFSPLSFYITDDVKLGNNPLHHCGAFYLQEPSASSAVTALDVQKHDKVLDLCAAPGGKATQAAILMNNTGLVVANDYNDKRSDILSENVERLGISNTIVLNNNVNTIANHFGGYFDKVILDAPCSGEGF